MRGSLNGTAVVVTNDRWDSKSYTYTTAAYGCNCCCSVVVSGSDIAVTSPVARVRGAHTYKLRGLRAKIQTKT